MITDPIAVSGANATVTSPTAQQTITSDFETFLQMLTVQMENQDPLNPIDSSDYAVQLATFSSVEQQVQTNELLADLGAQLTTSGMADVATWVGREARSDAPAYFDGAPITILPDPAGIADDVTMIVRNSTGAEVQRLTLPTTSDPIEWAGVDSSGRPLPEGFYSFEVVSSQGGEPIQSDPAEHYAMVREVRNDGGVISVILNGGSSVLASKVTALRAPDDL